MESANQAPIKDQLVGCLAETTWPSAATGATCFDLKRRNPDIPHAIAKRQNAIDQYADCSEDENAGSMTKGNESNASIEPTFDSE